MLKSKTICHQGLVREQNEDSFISNIEESIWLVADGVGGNVGGDIASQLAVQLLDTQLRQGRALVESIVQVNDSIVSEALKQPELQGMATTIVAAKFDGSLFELSWVGDSRAYLINSRSIRQISTDHNVANELVSQGDISKEEAVTHAGQHELTQALGQLSLSTIPLVEGDLQEGDILLLCSDGLSGVLSDEDMFETFCNEASIDDVANSLLSQVLGAGAPDNITFSIISHSDQIKKDYDEIKVQGNTENSADNHNATSVYRAHFTWAVLFFAILVMIIMFVWVD